MKSSTRSILLFLLSSSSLLRWCLLIYCYYFYCSCFRYSWNSMGVFVLAALKWPKWELIQTLAVLLKLNTPLPMAVINFTSTILIEEKSVKSHSLSMCVRAFVQFSNWIFRFNSVQYAIANDFPQTLIVYKIRSQRGKNKKWFWVLYSQRMKKKKKKKIELFKIGTHMITLLIKSR